MTFSLKKKEGGFLLKASGKSVEQALADAGKGLFSIATDFENIKPVEGMMISCSALSLKYLLVEWLNMILADAEMESMVFCEFEIEPVKKIKNRFFLEAQARGEMIDADRHPVKHRLKCASVKELSYTAAKKPQKHTFQCFIETMS